jgi:hypothetical protein
MSHVQPLAFSQFSGFGQPGQGNFPPGNLNPYSDVPLGPPPKKSKTWLWILLGGGLVALVALIACGGIIYFSFSEGLAIFEQDLMARLNASPTAQKHLGTIESVEFDLLASTKATNKNDGEQVFLFHVQGTQGKADLIGTPDQSGTTGITDAKLVLPSGEEVELSL